MKKSKKNQAIYFLAILLLFFGCKKEDETKNELIGTWERSSNGYNTTISFTANSFEFKRIHTTNDYITDILKANYKILKLGLIEAEITYSENNGNTQFDEIGTKDTLYCQILASGVLSFRQYSVYGFNRIKGNSNSLINSFIYRGYYEEFGKLNHQAKEFLENEIRYYLVQNNSEEMPTEWGEPTNINQLQIFDKYYIEIKQDGSEITQEYVVFDDRIYMPSEPGKYAKQ